MGGHRHGIHVDVDVAYEGQHIGGRERHIGVLDEIHIMLHVAEHDWVQNVLRFDPVLIADVHAGQLSDRNVVYALQNIDMLLLEGRVRLVCGGTERGRVRHGIAPGGGEVQGIRLQ